MNAVVTRHRHGLLGDLVVFNELPFILFFNSRLSVCKFEVMRKFQFSFLSLW